MRLLLDTNALIRWSTGTLKPVGVAAIKRADIVAVSAITGVEISIKRQLGKLRFGGSVEYVTEVFGFIELPVTLRHADCLLELPAHHGDPFDRLLIAQAIEEGFTIMTSDRAFDAYRVPVLWV